MEQHIALTEEDAKCVREESEAAHAIMSLARQQLEEELVRLNAMLQECKQDAKEVLVKSC